MNSVTLPDIEIIIGAAFEDVLEIYQDAELTEPVNLTGKVFAGQLRSAPVVTGTLQGSFDITVNSPATSGAITRSIPAVETALIPVGRFFYDIVETSGQKTVWFTGAGTARNGITA